MISFKVSAPGRIVLSGEHTAAYGKYFIATSLDRRTTLEFNELFNTPENNIRIEFPDVNIKQNIPLKLVTPFFSLQNIEDIVSNPVNLLEYVKYFITLYGMWAVHEQRFSLQIFFFMLFSIAHREQLEIKPFRIKVSTELTVAAGLGSSTSFAVCLAACFVHWKRLQHGNDTIEFNDADLESIKGYTVSCEKNMQDYVFAELDAHVCTYGHIVKCRRIGHIEYQIADSKDIAEMYILLIDSIIYINKCKREQQTAELYVNSPFNFYFKLDELNTVAEEMYKTLIILSNAIRQDHADRSLLNYITIWFNNVRFCVERNHELLTEYHLSVWAFDIIYQTANMFGFTAKLTGFSIQYAYILLPQNVTTEEIIYFKIHIEQRKFKVLGKIKINCKGVRIVN